MNKRRVISGLINETSSSTDRQEAAWGHTMSAACKFGLDVPPEVNSIADVARAVDNDPSLIDVPESNVLICWPEDGALVIIHVSSEKTPEGIHDVCRRVFFLPEDNSFYFDPIELHIATNEDGSKAFRLEGAEPTQGETCQKELVERALSVLPALMVVNGALAAGVVSAAKSKLKIIRGGKA